MKKQYRNVILITLLLIAVLGISVTLYFLNMPKRNVQAAEADYKITATALVNEYLTNETSANTKYLDSEGDSKILEITGDIKEIYEDFNNNKVVLLQAESDPAGVSCTFTQITSGKVKALVTGEHITIKGVIRSGASYDSELKMFENAILEGCDLMAIK